MDAFENLLAASPYGRIAPCRVEALACQRGAGLVFDNLSFAVKPGTALMVRGANGSGKSSLLRQLAGLLPVAAGRISHGAAHHHHIHYLGHQDGLKAALSVAETLAFDAALAGARRGDEAASNIAHLLGLAHKQWQFVGDLSAGQKRRLTLARLLLAPRALWLLDEPFTALDAQGVALVDALARAHLACGGMIVAASHIELGFATQTLDLDEASAATPTQKEAD